MHNICNTREMRKARKSRSSYAYCAYITWPVYTRHQGAPRLAALRACEASDPTGHYTKSRGSDGFRSCSGPGHRTSYICGCLRRRTCLGNPCVWWPLSNTALAATCRWRQVWSTLCCTWWLCHSFRILCTARVICRSTRRIDILERSSLLNRTTCRASSVLGLLVLAIGVGGVVSNRCRSASQHDRFRMEWLYRRTLSPSCSVYVSCDCLISPWCIGFAIALRAPRTGFWICCLLLRCSGLSPSPLGYV